MTPTRRNILMGAAALSAAVVTPEMARAAAALNLAHDAGSADWALATRDLEADVAPQAMRRIRGRAPAGLEGTLFRNGPGKFRRAGGSATHWFDGDGLMRSFDISGGQVTLRARFADTNKRRTETELDAVVTPGFGTPGRPGARIDSVDDANCANTAVMVAGDKVWALWEGGSPLQMDAETLATEQYVTLKPDLKGMPFQAHPRFDPDGTIWNVGANGAQVIVWHLNRGGDLIEAQVVTLPRASYFHDFTATDRHLIFVLQPWVHERNGMPFTTQFGWRPEMGTQVVVLDKADLTRSRVYELPTFSFFHLGDAWADSDGTIRFDVAAGKDIEFAVEGARVLVEGRGRVPGEPTKLARRSGRDGVERADGRVPPSQSPVRRDAPQPDRSYLRRDDGSAPADGAGGSGLVDRPLRRLPLRHAPCGRRSGVRAETRRNPRTRRLANRPLDRPAGGRNPVACVRRGPCVRRAAGDLGGGGRAAGGVPRGVANLNAR